MTHGDTPPTELAPSPPDGHTPEERITLAGLRDTIAGLRISRLEKRVKGLEEAIDFTSYVGIVALYGVDNKDHPFEELVPKDRQELHFEERVNGLLDKYYLKKADEAYVKTSAGNAGIYSGYETFKTKREMKKAAKHQRKAGEITGREAANLLHEAALTAVDVPKYQVKAELKANRAAGRVIKEATQPLLARVRHARLGHAKRRLAALKGEDYQGSDAVIFEGDTPIVVRPITRPTVHKEESNWPNNLEGPVAVGIVDPALRPIEIVEHSPGELYKTPSKVFLSKNAPAPEIIASPQPHTKEEWQEKADPKAVLGVRDEIKSGFLHEIAHMRLAKISPAQREKLIEKLENGISDRVLSAYLGTPIEEIDEGRTVPEDVLDNILDMLNMPYEELVKLAEKS